MTRTQTRIPTGWQAMQHQEVETNVLYKRPAMYQGVNAHGATASRIQKRDFLKWLTAAGVKVNDGMTNDQLRAEWWEITEKQREKNKKKWAMKTYSLNLAEKLNTWANRGVYVADVQTIQEMEDELARITAEHADVFSTH